MLTQIVIPENNLKVTRPEFLRAGRSSKARNRLLADQIRFLTTGGSIARNRTDAHRVVEASQRNEIIVNRIKIALLGAGQGIYGVSRCRREGCPSSPTCWVSNCPAASIAAAQN